VSDAATDGAAPPTSPPSVTDLGGGQYLVETGRSQQLAYAVTVGPHTWVYLDGATYLIEARPHGRAAPASAVAQAELASPMPATVIAVAITPGQRVSSGDILIRLEAMKMELPIVAPRDGVIRTVTCQAGELVQPGVPLVTFEVP